MMADCESIEDVIGKIIDVSFKSPRNKGNIENTESGMAYLKIGLEDSSEILEVIFPFESRNILDPIIIGSVLIGEDVHYKEEILERHHRFGHYTAPWKETCWTLEMLSGKMKGHVYQMKKEGGY